jgi:hypothetical protein
MEIMPFKHIKNHSEYLKAYKNNKLTNHLLNNNHISSQKNQPLKDHLNQHIIKELNLNLN